LLSLDDGGEVHVEEMRDRVIRWVRSEDPARIAQWLALNVCGTAKWMKSSLGGARTDKHVSAIYTAHSLEVKSVEMTKLDSFGVYAQFACVSVGIAKLNAQGGLYAPEVPEAQREKVEQYALMQPWRLHKEGRATVATDTLKTCAAAIAARREEGVSRRGGARRL